MEKFNLKEYLRSKRSLVINDREDERISQIKFNHAWKFDVEIENKPRYLIRRA